MKKTYMAMLLLACSLTANAQKPVYKDASQPVELRVADLLSRMTLDEKIGQVRCPLGWFIYDKDAKGKVSLTEKFYKYTDEQYIGNYWAVLRADPWTQKTLTTGLNPALSAEMLNMMQRYAVEKTRLGIPIMVAEETPHGHMAIGATVFPTALSQAATFDRDVLFRMGEAMGAEIRAQGAHVGYGPVIDIAREPRWSRMEETFGEDPTLAGILATEVVRGMQGDLNLNGEVRNDGNHVYSTLKHFAAYGIPEGGLNGEMASVGERTLLSEYVPQFKRTVEAGVGSIMTSYNMIDGIPCTSNRHLLTEVLRDTWGFKGAIYSDLQSIEGVAQTHHCAENWEEAGALAVNAGVDIDLEGNSYQYLRHAIETGKASEADLDRAVSKVLTLKFNLGLFENPYVDAKRAARIVRSEEHQQLAREVARKGICLLENDGTLPLSKDLRHVAVIGPNADMMYNQLGDYTAPQDRSAIATVLDGVRAMLPTAEVEYVKGCAIRDTTTSDIAAAVAAAKRSEVTILVVGGSSARDFKTEYLSTGAALVGKGELSDMDSGEGYDRASLQLMGDQERLMQALIDAGVKLVVVYIEGRPLNMNLAAEKANALLTAWYPGGQGGMAIADVLFGDYNPAGRIPVSIPRNVGQIPVYYSKHPSHDYIDSPAAPLYSFGYGKSYTTFAYSNLVCATVKPAPGEDVLARVTFTVTNTGDRDGEEVPQLYVRDVTGSVETPHMALKNFDRIALRAGESRTVTFELRHDDLALYNLKMEHVVEPGEFKVMVGAASNDIRLEGSFRIN
ncbi:MAG: glycoside hydrolase family 3 C-terminal domain-containing protein [Bacteroidales bacterium]|nr:glycoside hydrolase family 3 C-terminal domain-containing protein [Bacteroidales bacterium]